MCVFVCRFSCSLWFLLPFFLYNLTTHKRWKFARIQVDKISLGNIHFTTQNISTYNTITINIIHNGFRCFQFWFAFHILATCPNFINNAVSDCQIRANEGDLWFSCECLPNEVAHSYKTIRCNTLVECLVDLEHKRRWECKFMLCSITIFWTDKDWWWFPLRAPCTMD